MALLIKGAHVYAPEDLGICDVLTVGKQVVAVGKDLTATLPELETIDAKGLILTPGFIDQHIHVTGGGGEGGPKTRTPELVLSELIACGTTSVVGVSGTDGSSRSMPNLLGKVRALQAEGVSAWMYTSNYAYPPTTLTTPHSPTRSLSLALSIFKTLPPQVVNADGHGVNALTRRSSTFALNEKSSLPSDLLIMGQCVASSSFCGV